MVPNEQFEGLKMVQKLRPLKLLSGRRFEEPLTEAHPEAHPEAHFRAFRVYFGGFWLRFASHVACN